MCVCVTMTLSTSATYTAMQIETLFGLGYRTDWHFCCNMDASLNKFGRWVPGIHVICTKVHGGVCGGEEGVALIPFLGFTGERGLQRSDRRVIYRRCEEPKSHQVSSVKDQQLTLKFLGQSCIHMLTWGLALEYILSIGMCCGMPGVQSHNHDRL